MRMLPFEDTNAPLFTMGRAADMLGLRPAFLRRLDEQGVVSPARSTGGQRRYSRRELETVGHVVDLMGEGLTLTGVRRVLEMQREIDELKQQLAELSAQRSATHRDSA